MLADGFSVISTVFTQCWRFFNSFYIPGTSVTPAAFGLFSLSVVLVLKIVSLLTKSKDS